MKKIIAAIIISTMTYSTVQAQPSMTTMHSLYMYNFIKNVQWQNVSNKYIIGIYANETTVTEISKVLGIRKFNGKSIEVKKISSASQASECHIVFISAENRPSIKEIKAKSNLKNMLLVSEGGSIKGGASIIFVVEDSKLKFKINKAVCTSSGLQVSKTLMSLGV